MSYLCLYKDTDVNEMGGQYDNALQAASVGCHAQIVQMLLNNEEDVNATRRRVRQCSAHRGFEIIVQMLLSNDADVNATEGFDGNASIRSH